jgi:L-alanine-DL-glutamate epimerase-like enolase superfamily enzyme
MIGDAIPIRALRAAAYTIPTDKPEADGTLRWDATTLVIAEVEAGTWSGLGYTYTSGAAVGVIDAVLAPVVVGKDALDTAASWHAMQRSVRNLGREGLAATAISAVDTALWDLKAKILDLPLARLLGRCRDAVPLYGSGGFTSYGDRDLRDQLAGWVEHDGCRWVKMKVGAEPERDLDRVRAAKDAIGARTLFVDANGAYDRKQALQFGAAFAHDADVQWFEEPVSSDDRAGLRFVRERAPATMEIAAGEYGYTLDYFRHMLADGAVDVLQADATRCGGFTGFLQAAAVAEAYHVALSSHCAPALHLPLACAVSRFRHIEWFHDHVRIERMLFDGAPTPRDGMIRPDAARPGIGLDFKRADAERFRK